MPLLHCKKCMHEWESVVQDSKCDWCGNSSYTLTDSTALEDLIKIIIPESSETITIKDQPDNGEEVRTALEQYQKPKTVSRDEKREVQYIHDVPRCFVESCYRTCTDQKRKERLGKMLGIEVEGPSPDDKS